MKINGFIWLEEIVDKIEVKHQVFPDEVEQVFDNQPSVKRMNKGHFRGEDVYRALGQTDAGRYLVVFFIFKLSREALIMSARDMDHKERRNYEG